LLLCEPAQTPVANRPIPNAAVSATSVMRSLTVIVASYVVEWLRR
jgi:hypothetical protein